MAFNCTIMVIAATVLLCSVVSGGCAAVERAAWMANGSYGVMVHYLIGPPEGTPESKTEYLNRCVDSFDLESFARQFAESGADWLIFTIGQNTGYYNSPNTYLDVMVPGRTPKRDVVLEIARRVRTMGKHFIAYLPAETMMQSPEMQQAFAWNPQDQRKFLKRYRTFVRAYAIKLGKDCDGWWFDGCYDSITGGGWDYPGWIDAARAGNPNAIVAFNDGSFCVGREKPATPLQDYHAGEVHLLQDGKIVFEILGADVTFTPEGRVLHNGAEPALYMPASQRIDGVQWHALVPVDSTFNATVPTERCHYTDETLIGFIKQCKRVRGAVTLNAPVDLQGHIPHTTAAQLKRIGVAIERK